MQSIGFIPMDLINSTGAIKYYHASFKDGDMF
jgi:hypothetical protein